MITHNLLIFDNLTTHANLYLKLTPRNIIQCFALSLCNRNKS